MITSQDWQKFAWQWLIACIAMRLLQILFDGLGSLFAGMLGISSTVILFGILAIFRAISGGLGGSLQAWALPRRIVHCRSWIIATTIGMAIAFLVTQ
jgi:hypothetical protein